MRDWRDKQPSVETPDERGAEETKKLQELLVELRRAHAAGEGDKSESALGGAESTIAAFEDMLAKLQGNKIVCLSERHRKWVLSVYERVLDRPVYENLASSGAVPRGKEVPTPEVLKNLPKAPPRRRNDF